MACVNEAIIQLSGRWSHVGAGLFALQWTNGRAAVRRPGRLRSRWARSAFARAGRPEDSDRWQLVEIRGLARASLLARSLPFARAVFHEAVSKRVSARVCRNLPHRLRRLRLLPVPQRGFLAQAICADAGAFSIRLQSAGTNNLQSVSSPSALRLAGRQGESGVSRCGCAAGDVPP